jgi:hypothetical protein
MTYFSLVRPKRNQAPGMIIPPRAVILCVLIPVPLGGPAVELFQLFIQPPLEKRRDAWHHTVS